MQNVIEKLREYSIQIDLKKRFDYNFDVNNKIFNSKEVKRLLTHQNPFDQNVELKWVLSEKYKQTKEQNFIDFWIINIWGGIRGFKSNDRNIDKIALFKKQIKKGKLSLDCFSTISSLSKISSFIEPDKFVIYDSRVIYTLNWLIMTCENQNGLNEKYYPMPSGRNKIIVDFDINTIINLKHISNYAEKKDLFFSKQEAYFQFCDFVHKTTKEIYGPNSKPYELEMLLFTLANKEIFKELKENLKITTGNNV